MIRRRIFAVAAGILLSFSGIVSGHEALQNGFRNPPDSARPQCWWHWVDRKVTAQGIAADLKAMREFGFSTAHLFAVMGRPGSSEWPEIMSPAWRKLFCRAAEEARKNNIQLGMNNCPGWTCSGGPWIKPEDSMKKLVFTENSVTGGRPARLAQPRFQHGFYRDTAVLAFPAKAGAIPVPHVAVTGKYSDPASLCDGDPESGILFLPASPGFKEVITLTYPEVIEAKVMTFQFGAPSIFMDLTIEVSTDGKTFTTAARKKMGYIRDRGDARAVLLHQGRGVRGKIFRLTLLPGDMPWWLGDRRLRICEIRASGNDLIPDVTSRNGMGGFEYMPEAPDTAGMPGIRIAQMVDLTGKMQQDGSLGADALPDGMWTVLRIGMTTTGAMNRPVSLAGLECDKLSKRGLDAHWPHMMGVLLEDTRDLKVIRSATIDSYEAGGQTWTDTLPEDFCRLRGYELRPWLPAVLGYVVESRGESARFLYDFQRTLSDLFAENYFDYFTELCHKNGLQSYIEPYWGPFDHIRAGRSADVPMGEFLTEEPAPVPMKLPAVIGNAGGRKRVGAEAFTSSPPAGRWQQTPYQLKRIGDKAWLSGVSLFIVHSYVHQPFEAAPGMSLGHHGIHVNRHTPWWHMGRAWSDYLARGQWLLQQGDRMADLLVLAGEGTPNHTPHLPDLYAAGWDFDYCSWNDVMELLRFRDGNFILGIGRRYPVFSLGRDKYLSLATLQKAEALLAAGGTVAGLPPTGSPTLADRGKEAEYRALIRRLWGGQICPGTVRAVGKGRLIVSQNPVQIMRLAGIPVRWQAPAGLGVVGRDAGKYRIYYLAPRSGERFRGKVRLEVPPGMVPEVWDAVTGKTSPLAVWKKQDNMVEWDLELDSGGSCFLVMVPGNGTAPVQEMMRKKTQIIIRRAIYRAVGSPDGKDVTGLVLKHLAASGSAGFPVTNYRLGGDPAPMKRKELYLEGMADGYPFRICIPENAPVDLSQTGAPLPGEGTFHRNRAGILFEKAGSMDLKLADGKKVTVTSGELPGPVGLNEDWQVTFLQEPALPEPVHFARLMPWNACENPAVRYFSGTAVYQKKFVLPETMFAEDLFLYLDLGEVRNVAEVFVNGRSAGVWWCPAFTRDVTGLLVPGENTVTVKVANVWPNRLIGDGQTAWKDPVTDGIPDWVRQGGRRSPSGRRTWSNYIGWKPTEKPLDSGLIGPAAIRCRRFVPVR